MDVMGKLHHSKYVTGDPSGPWFCYGKFSLRTKVLAYREFIDMVSINMQTLEDDLGICFVLYCVKLYMGHVRKKIARRLNHVTRKRLLTNTNYKVLRHTCSICIDNSLILYKSQDIKGHLKLCHKNETQRDMIIHFKHNVISSFFKNLKSNLYWSKNFDWSKHLSNEPTPL